jgi:DnaJ like chaperone protein
MSFSKWIGGALGWSFGGPIGAIIGLAIGSVIDSMADNGQPLLGDQQKRRRGRTTYRTQPRQRPQTQSGDFEVSLLVLASVIIKADGVQDQRELDYVRKQFVNMYGKDRANHAFNTFSIWHCKSRWYCNSG